VLSLDVESIKGSLDDEEKSLFSGMGSIGRKDATRHDRLATKIEKYVRSLLNILGDRWQKNL